MKEESEIIMRGTRLKIFILKEMKEYYGVLLTDYNICSKHVQRPQIQLDNGRIISGSECWWTPEWGEKLIDQKML